MDGPCGIREQRQFIIASRVGRVAHQKLGYHHISHFDGMTLLVNHLAVNRSRRQLLCRGKQRRQQECYEDELRSHEWITEIIGKYYLSEGNWPNQTKKAAAQGTAALIWFTLAINYQRSRLPSAEASKMAW